MKVFVVLFISFWLIECTLGFIILFYDSKILCLFEYISGELVINYYIFNCLFDYLVKLGIGLISIFINYRGL